MVQIQLTGESARLVFTQSQAAGFGDDVNQYVSQLILINQPAAAGKVPSPRTHEELIQMLDEGIASGISPMSFEEQMQSLRAEIPSPRNEEELARMIQEGIDSPDAPLPWDEYMAMLEADIRARGAHNRE